MITFAGRIRIYKGVSVNFFIRNSEASLRMEEVVVRLAPVLLSTLAPGFLVFQGFAFSPLEILVRKEIRR